MTKELAKVKQALWEVCDAEHARCNPNCPVWKRMTYAEQGLPECPCFKDGKKMLDFLTQKR